MGTKTPLVLYDGRLGELRSGDEIASGASKLVQWKYSSSNVRASGSSYWTSLQALPSIAQAQGYSPLTVAFTPASAANVLEVSVELNLGPTVTGACMVCLFDTIYGTYAVDTWCEVINAGFMRRAVLTTLIAAGSTAARTFSVRYGGLAASRTVYVNQSYGITNQFYSSLKSKIAVKEYAP